MKGKNYNETEFKRINEKIDEEFKSTKSEIQLELEEEKKMENYLKIIKRGEIRKLIQSLEEILQLIKEESSLKEKYQNYVMVKVMLALNYLVTKELIKSCLETKKLLDEWISVKKSKYRKYLEKSPFFWLKRLSQRDQSEIDYEILLKINHLKCIRSDSYSSLGILFYLSHRYMDLLKNEQKSSQIYSFIYQNHRKKKK